MRYGCPGASIALELSGGRVLEALPREGSVLLEICEAVA